MNLHWIDIAFIVVMVAAGGGIIYLFLMRRFEGALAASQRDMERRLAVLTEQITLCKLDADDAAEVSSGTGTSDLDMPAFERAQPGWPPQSDNSPAADLNPPDRPDFSQKLEDLPPHIQVAITAAAIAAFGNHARVRSARRVPSSDVVSPWTQQGRVIVQSSHNLRMRG